MNDYVAVIGAANIDVGGQPHRQLVYKDSNTGRISIGYGGVGRNISHNLSLLGVPVKLFTSVGGDALGRDLLEHCNSLGIDTSEALVKQNEVSSMYIFINDDIGDMALALSDVKIDRSLTPEFLATKMDIINNAKIVVIDCNVSAEAFEYIANNCTAPIFVDPVSQDQARKIGKNLGKINTIKPNILEAEFLTGMTIGTIVDAKAAAKALLDTGIERVFLSMSHEGILVADKNNMTVVPSCDTNIVCTTGAGDSSMAAIVWSYFNDVEDIVIAARAANAAGSLTIQSESTIHPDMSAELILNKIRSEYE